MKNIINGIAMFIAMVFLISKCGNCGDDNSQERNDRDMISCAYTMSHDFVKSKLNYPDEADFHLSSANTTKIDKYDYRIVGEVSAKNAFGVSKTYKYNCVIRYDGVHEKFDPNSWELVSLVI